MHPLHLNPSWLVNSDLVTSFFKADSGRVYCQDVADDRCSGWRCISMM